MKKLISTILATAMIVSIATSLGAYAYANTYSDGDIIESGNVEYTVLSAKDKTCAISGYYGNELNFVVPSTFDNFTITEISLLAFYGSKIESISVPSTVKAIGGSAFENCANLESVTLPSGIKSIGANAFAGTAYLSNEENWNGSAFYIGDYLYNVKTDCTGRFEIKEGTTLIADCAFSSYDSENDVHEFCTEITEISMPDSVEHIGVSAFEGCKDLEKINFSKNLKTIGSFAFDETAFYYDENNWEKDCLYVADKFLCAVNDKISGRVVIKEGVENITDSVFFFCENITEVVIPSSVTRIGEASFGECSSLAKITIPNSVTEIGAEAFIECPDLKEITIPASVEKIGDFALGYYLDLESDALYKKYDGFTIKGYKGTETERYANNENLNFTSLGKAPLANTGKNSKTDTESNAPESTTKPDTSNKSPKTGISSIAFAILSAAGAGIVLIKKENKI